MCVASPPSVIVSSIFHVYIHQASKADSATVFKYIITNVAAVM